MKTTTSIPGLLVLHLNVQYNDDGWFKENWHRASFGAAGLPDFGPVQQNVTHTVDRGVTRGFHAEPWDRLITLTSGRAMGAWVDLRPGESFGRTFYCDLDTSVAVFVPRGVANAHQVLEDGTTFSYLLEHHWTPDARKQSATANLFDPALNIPWPISRDRALVAQRDASLPLLQDAPPMPPRRTLVVGTDTSLGRALARQLPQAVGLPSSAFDAGAAPIDLWAFDTIIGAAGRLPTGLPDQFEREETWSSAAVRAHRLAEIARTHRLRYVHLSADGALQGPGPEHGETDALDLGHPHGQALAAGELIAATVPRHLIIRTGWVMDPDEGFLRDMTARARHHQPVTVLGDYFGRLTFTDSLAAGIIHLVRTGAAPGVYNLTGDGRSVSWAQAAQRVFQIVGADPALVHSSAVADAPSPALLRLDKIKATGFRPDNAWLGLIDKVPGAKPAPLPATPAAGTAATRMPGRPYTVMFVCTANICRSAYADVVARARRVPGLRFLSAGIQALVGHEIDPPMAARVVDGDSSTHRARQLTRAMLEEADLVVAMAADHRRYILDSWPALGRKVFVIGHIARELASLPESATLAGVTEHLWRHRTSDTSDDVPDPYGRGDAAARSAADSIDAHLDIILGALTELAGRD
ncbi:dTDP-4-dehydrorhamnose 3,5-epimerase family protein [Tessaracoccus sp. MC1865]|uniref:dTDP-4-dehydrorhamnose 3,5-epimerase family protein n=1 Tax=Tessaracoccus sp. MC1865 TaxID=2760310 RepID=UPI0016007654|nr:dTDP-4-dehydrorhamnose 3,5-epimerase family protein [Tessaracoccus sp. MC1865]MBB1484002.1 dTDP-4-dehydrorhamnose 3,5-epimerase family protein [Tessaracoccus sp. MC1865]QTO37046.1 dTDP-4-dehydrorhamnose 3,5-epimerase family protein [Tessaracoccus sp. MC1865]